MANPHLGNPASFPTKSGTTVYVQGFTAAGYKQRATLNGGGAKNIVLDGQHSKRMSPATAEFKADGGDVTVTIEHNAGGGWVKSQVTRSQFKEQETNSKNVLEIIASEDAGDRDYNDCVVLCYYTTGS